MSGTELGSDPDDPRALSMKTLPDMAKRLKLLGIPYFYVGKLSSSNFHCQGSIGEVSENLRMLSWIH